jgi:hypothetical protein
MGKIKSLSFFVFVVMSAFVLSGAIARRATIPAVTSFKINNDASLTDMTKVILNNTVFMRKADGYRADERNDFANRPNWLPYSSAPEYSFLNQSEGVKTIYFQVKFGSAFSTIVSDTIQYKIPKPFTDFPAVVPHQADPKILSASINITRTSAWEEPYEKKYGIELAYDFQVADVPNADKLSIDILAIPKTILSPSGGGEWPPEATRHHRYSEGTRSGSTIRFGGTLSIVHTGMVGFSETAVGLNWLSEHIKFVIRIPSDYGYWDPNVANNQVTKEIRFGVRSVKNSKVSCECMGLIGTGGDWNFSLGSSVSPLAWIAGSILRLHQCGATNFENTELKCDQLPMVPKQGERLVRFSKRPNNQDRNGTVHWACEGQGNWAPATSATNEGGQCPGAQFRWEVETYCVVPAIVE